MPRFHLLVLFALVQMLCLSACDRKEHTAAANVVVVAKNTAPCLPCHGHEVEIEADTPKFDFEGKTYYFCSDECREKFQKNPEKYVPKPATAPANP